MKNKGKLANALFFLSLLCIFVMGSVLVVSYQIMGYQNIVEKNEMEDNTHTPLAYLQNKARLYDKAGGISIAQYEGNNVLVLHDEKTNIYIYEYHGYLCELLASKDYTLDFSDGDRLFKIDKFVFTAQPNGLQFMIQNGDVKQYLFVAFTSKGVNV